ncbi:glycerophosphoryl diester phosphodiesterase [Nitrosomonas marina]|uniref:Glycerophosphoryl diester phosphodiesterase n=1 Tax=Nitrosomonas marina TaxID=917 RepID=A0A1I0ALE1_9PROT|nr:glycerophosphodiester phosphodiesterase [Nitrosomonas marina]SES94682.1 glycerophosphoryl diester phosphodiesterase [Nitrosomonas marina]
MQQQSSKCQIFAHRGASREAMENTRAAFEHALLYAIDGIETDVQLSRDEVAVLWHDESLDKIGLAGQHIDDFDLAQLETLNFPQTGVKGIMTLKTFLNDYNQHCRLLIEVKNHDREPVIRHEIKMRRVIDLIKEVSGSRTADRLLVSSFNLQSLVYAHQQGCDIPLVYNIDDHQTIADVQQALHDCTFLYGFCLPIALLDQHLSDQLRAHYKRIIVYTCNTDDQINKALQLGVDILISDVPDKAIEMRNARPGGA